MTAKPNRYDQLIQGVFEDNFQAEVEEFTIDRALFEAKAKQLGIPLPKNLGDIIYTYRYRRELPAAVRATATEGRQWVIMPAGKSLYRFTQRATHAIVPDPAVPETKVPSATPGIIASYSLTDEQALLAVIRYNRLIDLFTRTAATSLQSHLRTTTPVHGQVETDEIYVGIDRRGAHYVIPVQAKGGSDRLSVVQIEQDFAVCDAKFPHLVAYPVAAQFMEADLVALFGFERDDDEIVVVDERHYRMVAPDEISSADLFEYQARLDSPPAAPEPITPTEGD